MEKEIKILEIDPDDLIARLESLGAKRVFDGDRTIIHYDTPDCAYRNEGKHLKVTREGGLKLTLTSGVGTSGSQEIKTKVGDSIHEILGQLNFIPIAEVSARRVSYELDTTDFDIDYFPGISPFLEIDVADVADVGALIESLGLAAAERRVMGTPEIFAYYGKDYFQEFKKA